MAHFASVTPSCYSRSIAPTCFEYPLGYPSTNVARATQSRALPNCRTSLLTNVNFNKGPRQLQVSSLYRHEACCGIADDGPTVPRKEWRINARFVSMTKSVADLGKLQAPPPRSTQRFAGPNRVSFPFCQDQQAIGDGKLDRRSVCHACFLEKCQLHPMRSRGYPRYACLAGGSWPFAELGGKTCRAPFQKRRLNLASLLLSFYSIVMVSLKLLALLLAPLSAIAHEAANSHGGQFVLTPSSGFSVGYKDSSPQRKAFQLQH